ncbi:MAG: DUF1611 domain-containing protein [Phaeodactylibacter sp.]|nr:DUF1611 domain-containing protein [Phaeodactylibacter sp.]MCB9273507.1 DUF1611 domain-containing protein [Lewinellaceae bacterium]
MDILPVLDGNAIVYCEGAFNTPNGKTAHGLVRHTRRYRILSVIDSRYAGQDAGQVLDGRPSGITIYATVERAIQAAVEKGEEAAYFVVGLAPDGGRLPAQARAHIRTAIEYGLNVDSGLHDFLSEDPDISALAQLKGIEIRDVRKTPPRSVLHAFSGNIEKVKALKIAVLGTDSAVGKRTTAWLIVQAFQQAGYKAEMIGTGQTAWMQGARYSLILDSLINDFVAGELEHATYQAWVEQQPDVIVIEGQGSLMNPAYPGGHEILAACRPDVVVLQHAPKRLEYDGFPGYALHPLPIQIEAVELLSGKPVVAVTVNHEDMAPGDVPAACLDITRATGLPAYDVLLQGMDGLLESLLPYLREAAKAR